MQTVGESVQPDEIARYLAAAVEIAEAAGPIALRYFRGAFDLENKSLTGTFDPVTQADREIEAAIRTELEQRFPGIGILGEELGETRGESSLRWVVDPIDGTRAFVTGMPEWGLLLGLADAERAYVGLMHQPFLKETFVGGGGEAELRAHGKTRRLQTRKVSGMEDAVLYSTDPTMFPDPPEREAFADIALRCRMTRYGGDCYAYCLLAMGQIDLIIEGQLQPYDIVPLIPIVEAAGGIVTSWTGGSALGGGKVVASGDRALHESVLARLAEHG